MNKKWLNRNIAARVILSLFAVVTFAECNPSGEKKEQMKIQNIISKMTLEQKAQLVVGTGLDWPMKEGASVSSLGLLSRMMIIPDNFDSSYHAMVARVRSNCPGSSGNTVEIPELGIKSMVTSDGPAGLRISPTRKGKEGTFFCTAFPIGTVLASSWDTTLVNEVGKAMGNEVLEYNSDIILGPGMNLQRDPLCGRNFEYYSEDPLVTGKIAASVIKGVQSNGVGNSAKHFAVNNQETYRQSVNTIVSQRALRELYLKGFEIAIKEAQPWTVMSSYNFINGTYASESNDLLTKILRDDWGFQGYVMTDWGGGKDVVAQMNAGNDLIQPGPKQVFEIIDAVKGGKLSEEVLNRNVAKILHVMFKTPKYRNYQASNKPDLKAHAIITRKAASEGMVLLKNAHNALPLTSDLKNIALFGSTSYELFSGGTGSGDVNEAYTASLLEGFKNGGFTPNEELVKIYSDYISTEHANPEKNTNFLAEIMGIHAPVKEMAVTTALAEKMASTSQVALITIGRNAGEAMDRTATPGDFYLNDVEKALIKNVSQAFQAKGKKVIVVLNIGGIIATADWSDLPDAVLCAWQPGQEAGNSIVDVLNGTVNPSGKLPMTIPLKYEDVPSSKNFPGHEVEVKTSSGTSQNAGFSDRNKPWEVVYEEDIYVGYRYYNTFNIPVAYEFGFGLSYTAFEYSNITINSSSFADKATVNVDVTNIGKVAGKEVVQVYMKAPAVKLEKPAMVLVDFGKTKLLAPGEVQTLSFDIEPIDLCSFDEISSSWVAEAGVYEVMVGASSRDIKGKVDFSLATEKTVETVSQSLAPKVTVNKLFTKKK
jgi:beta-glucosidase